MDEVLLRWIGEALEQHGFQAAVKQRVRHVIREEIRRQLFEAFGEDMPSPSDIQGKEWNEGGETAKRPQDVFSTADSMPDAGDTGPRDQGARGEGTPSDLSPTACYLYGIAHQTEAQTSWSVRGLDHREVYSVVSDGLVAIVHDCDPRPYASDDMAQVPEWLFQHEEVLAAARTVYGAVIPMRFDTILYREGQERHQVIRSWLDETGPRLAETFQRIGRKLEYGIQIWADPEVLRADGAQQSPSDKPLAAEDPSLAGLKYLSRLQQESRLEKMLADHEAALAQRFHEQIAEFVSETMPIRSTRQQFPQRLLVSVSCLADPAELQPLQRWLATLQESGYRVIFTGPLSPYSFVSARAD